jgi:hypothetical protein
MPDTRPSIPAPDPQAAPACGAARRHIPAAPCQRIAVNFPDALDRVSLVRASLVRASLVRPGVRAVLPGPSRGSVRPIAASPSRREIAHTVAIEGAREIAVNQVITP